MKKIFLYILTVLLFNFCISVQALDLPKNYLKGKFYKSVKDNFLVATEKMKDPRFKRTVLVMFENDEQGAWGLVINKPIGSLPMTKLIELPFSTSKETEELGEINIPVFWGGPVATRKIFVLHSNEYQNNSTINYEGISISQNYKILLDISKNKGPKKNLVILGYSGWGDGQLEGEMEREDWALSEINIDLIFERDNAKKWLNAINNSFIRL